MLAFALASRTLQLHPARAAYRLALSAAAVAIAVSSATAQVCDPATGSPPAEVILGPNGEQFRPENEDCPDRFTAPTCKNGTVMHWVDPQDPDGLTRYACVSSPDGAQNLPLVVFLHGSRIRSVDMFFGGEGFRRPRTDLQKLQESADLGGPTPGYVLLAPQGRCMEARRPSSGDGVRFDVWHKDPEANLDARAIRAFIQQLESRSSFDASGQPVALPSSLATIDPKRVYLLDSSEGGYFAHFLSLAFPDEFAAVASHAAASPFTRLPCPTPFPGDLSRRPGFIMVHAECDPIVPCESVQRWIGDLSDNGWSDADNVEIITDSTKRQARDSGCLERSRSTRSSCRASAHTTFPNPQLPAMFDFLKRYELP